RPATDWIGMYKINDPNANFISWKYTGGGTSGTIEMTSFITQGSYEFRYFLDNGYTLQATSNKVTVTTPWLPMTATPATTTLMGVRATPSRVAPGANIRVYFTAPAGQPKGDWIALYKVGQGINNYLAWQYTNGAASGYLNFPAPATPGDYEFRYNETGGAEFT